MSGITPLPTPPSTSDPSNFSTRADDFLAALPTFANEANALAAELNNISTTSTSVTSNTIGTGSKAFTVETGKSYFPGQSVTIARTGAPTNRMFAVVDSYDSGTGALVVTSQAFEGSGTFTDWTITLGFNGVIQSGQIAASAVSPEKLSNASFISIIGASKNLVIVNNFTFRDSQVDIDADEIILKDSAGRAYLAEAVNLTADIATSGANGLDTGTEANSTWYYLWVIYNGTTVASLISASSTAPTLPSGYTYKAMVGAIYNESGGDFIKILQKGNRCFRNFSVVTTTVPPTSRTSLSLATSIPPNAKTAFMSAQWRGGAAATTTHFYTPSNDDNIRFAGRYASGGSTSYRSEYDFEIPIAVTQTIYYIRTGDAFTDGALYCNGWEI